MSRSADRPYPSSFLATAVLFATLLFTGCKGEDSVAQTVPPADDTPVVSTSDSDRAQQILDNLKYEIPQLREIPVIIGDIRDGEIVGMDRGSFMVQGQTYHFLVTEDNSQLFMLAAPAMNVGRSSDALAAAYAEEAEEEARQAAETAAALAQAAETLPSIGPADAPVVIVEFSDFQCPYCKLAEPTVKQLIAKYPTEVRLAYAHYPLPNHPWAKPAAVATECAISQDPGLFWGLHDTYFDNQAQLNPGNVIDFTRTHLADSGIDLEVWTTCATVPDSEGYKAAEARINAQAAIGQGLGISGTPAFYINGTLVSGAKPLEEFSAAVDAALAK